MLTLVTCHVGMMISHENHIRPTWLTFHATGVAAVYAAWAPNIQCSSSNGDEEGVCELVNTYILIAAWIIPVLRELTRFRMRGFIEHGSLQSSCIAAASPSWSTVEGGALLQKVWGQSR